MENLKGKIALITGVSRKKGIGFAIAQALAQNGVSVYLAYFRPYDVQVHEEENPQEIEEIIKEIERTGSEVETLEIDLSLPESPKFLLAEVIKRFGKVDILINNACYSGNDTVATLDTDSLDKHYAVNVRATLLLTTEFAKQFSGTDGWVISMTSGQGVGPMTTEIAYASTKGAIDAFTLSASPDLAKKNIKIYALDPGPVDTGWMTEELKTEVAKSSSRNRITEPKDVAQEVLSILAGEGGVQSGQVIRRRYGI